MIAVESTAWNGVTRPTSDNGLGFGFKWNMGWMHDTLQYLKREPIHRSFHHNEITFSILYAWSCGKRRTSPSSSGLSILKETGNTGKRPSLWERKTVNRSWHPSSHYICKLPTKNQGRRFTLWPRRRIRRRLSGVRASEW